MKRPEISERAQTISSMIMALIVGGIVLTILVAVSMTKHPSALPNWVGTLAVVATIAIVANQLLRDINEMMGLQGIGGLGKALTKIAAPLAAAMLAVVISGQLTGWSFFGLLPLTAPAWDRLATRVVECE